MLKGYELGPTASKRWIVSLSVSLLESFFIIEPIKVIISKQFIKKYFYVFILVSNTISFISFP